MNNKKNLIKLFGTILLLTLILGLLGCTTPPSKENSFQSIAENSICKLEGKPIIRMYSTSICPHCIWVEPAYDAVVKKYVDENKIIAYHWEWIINSNGELVGVDDKLTSEVETSMSASEDAIFKEFSPNTYVPAFIFGCKYYRIGNQFEIQKDLNAEKVEFTRIIEELLKE
jgi:thiol-disulfide isomerase/thioredoxin